MHILKIIHGYPTSYNAGSEVYSQSICNELSKTHKVSVFTREENPYKKDFEIRHEREHQNLDFYFVNNPQGKDGYKHKKNDKNFAKLIKSIKPDVAHVGHLNHLSTGLIDELNKQKIPKKSKKIIDEIDKILAKHYNFTDEERSGPKNLNS